MATPSFAQGAILRKDTTGTDLPIAGMGTISGPTTSADQIDVTSHDSISGFRQYIRGLVDPGTLTFDLFYDGNDASHKALMEDLSNVEVPEEWTLIFSDSTQITFDAKTNGFEFNVPVDGALTVSVTLQVTGAIGYPQ